MEKIAISLVFAFICATASGQTNEIAFQTYDSLVFVPQSVVDTALRGLKIFDVLPDGVDVRQSEDVRRCVENRVEMNHASTVNGYRIRIFFDNGKDARTESQSILYRFKSKFPETAAYRTFVNPYFKVTVGDFRTWSEARAMLSQLNSQFPSAFIVKEKLRFPSIEGEKAFIVDTVRIRHSNPRGL